MPTRSQVIDSLVRKYDAQITGTESAVIESAIAKLAITQLVDAVFSGGGGGGATSATVQSGVESATNINQILTKITSLDNKTIFAGVGTLATSLSVGIASDQIVKTSFVTNTIPITQTSINIRTERLDSYTIPINAKSFTICIKSDDFVYYTEDGSIPTLESCWFSGNSKEIWDWQIPDGATIIFLAGRSDANISIQVRM